MKDITQFLLKWSQKLNEETDGDRYAGFFAEVPDVIKECKKEPLHVEVTEGGNTVFTIKRNSEKLSIVVEDPQKLSLLIKPILGLTKMKASSPENTLKLSKRILENIRPMIKDFADILEEVQFKVEIQVNDILLMASGSKVKSNLNKNFGRSFIDISKTSRLIYQTFQ